MENTKRSFADIIKEDALVLIDFSAEWCGPCQMMKPVLEELKRKNGDTLRILKIDVDKNQSLAAAYQVQGVPTFVLFSRGEQVWRQSGAMPLQQLQQVIQQYS
ncbi:MAG: thioredoxin [Flavobacteriales bacterium]